ncbi:flavodoxin domain-containing protein [Actinotalea sp. K2]|uniref:flavodoxin domain-containing protein n=1 Tax=Actinotalea sp. K2 TaxID=2939438 RepID=UPI00201732C2|nr:flavodoxin domain-containing protein [Actinotalea sp. K2]MCL3859745.1 flavodoxin domain-containing protein [Actinotalea sp. K2]
MSVLVAYASRHGSTEGIARRIAATLTEQNRPALARSVLAVDGFSDHEAVVVGSAVQHALWLEEAVTFVRRFEDELAVRPVWFFSCGPLGVERPDVISPPVWRVARPPDLTDLIQAVGAREHRVFHGALDPRTLGYRERAARADPAVLDELPAGDFRDWAEVDWWAQRLAREMRWLCTRHPAR